MSLVTSLVDRLNDEHGGALQASASLGGDPYALAICGMWEDLERYEALQRGVGFTEEARALVQLSGTMFEPARTEELIYRVVVPGDADPEPITIVNSADIVLDRYSEAIDYCIAMTTTSASLGDRSVGFATAIVGPRTRVMWWHTAATIATAAELIEKVETEPRFVEGLHAGAGLFQPGSVHRQLWRRLN